MKRLVKLTLIFTITLLYSDDIDDIINKINSKRESKIPQAVIANSKSPIPEVKIIESNSSKESNNTVIVNSAKEVFELKAIINSRANINGKWVGIGDLINGYKVVDIMDDSVYLKDGNKSKMIFFNNIKKIKIFAR